MSIVNGGNEVKTRGELTFNESFSQSSSEELQRLARSVRRHQPSATLRTTTVVNEVWLKLKHSPKLASVSKSHLMAAAAKATRQLLAEEARRRSSVKGVGEVFLVTLSNAAGSVPFSD